ncbi:hypothetical protein CENSYa_1680 [Cenarchaeum symbiosum A]|uniref:Uncharacterized protein n=1 Tax=Cenarchaeum symbiosum (strain A) TaxID=414004 RepID=A0RY80_CENSY|nr:hypothetical protein CENSYa_1680 [Cenarchaeum symbiosum A]
MLCPCLAFSPSILPSSTSPGSFVLSSSMMRMSPCAAVSSRSPRRYRDLIFNRSFGLGAVISHPA